MTCVVDFACLFFKSVHILVKNQKHCIGTIKPLQKNPTVLTMLFLIFLFSIHILGASDPHSGVKRIKYRFRAQSTGKVINDREYEYLNPKRVSNDCLFVYEQLLQCTVIWILHENQVNFLKNWNPIIITYFVKKFFFAYQISWISVSVGKKTRRRFFLQDKR